MGTWINLQKGFAASERLTDAIVGISSTNVFNNVARIYRQTLKSRPAITLTSYGTTN